MRIEQASSLVIKTLVASLCLLIANGCRKDRDRTEGPSSTANQRPVEPITPNGTQNDQGQDLPGQGGQGQTTQDQNTQGQYTQDQNTQGQDPDLATATITVIDIDPRLATVCAIAPANTSFKFDSASPNAEARDRLDLVATCVTAGAAKGKKLRVVGHPDTTGSDTYSQQMGKSRAEAVAEYLRTRGVQGQRVESETKTAQPGASGAPGTTSMPGWSASRRVIILLES
jgi:outer membrane protein OmpA-like peptidoglycan-associated protein